MASLKEAASRILYDAKDGISWLVVWKEGRSWNIESYYIDYNDRTHRFSDPDHEYEKEFSDIVSKDRNAIIVNGYYDNLGPFEEMTLATLVDGLRWQYEEIKGSMLSDALEWIKQSA